MNIDQKQQEAFRKLCESWEARIAKMERALKEFFLERDSGTITVEKRPMQPEPPEKRGPGRPRKNPEAAA